MSTPRGVDAVERALSVLACFQVAGETLTLAQLAQRCCLYKSTILRLAISLQRKDFLKRDEKGRYSLGDELRHLGDLTRVSGELENTIRPELKLLTAATGETVSFYVRQGRDRILLFREVSPGSVRHYLVEGGRHALFVGATGRIFKAYGSGGQDGESIQIRRRGWVVSRGERKCDLGAVAVPVLNAKRELLGVLNVAVMLSRLTKTNERKTRVLLIESRKRLQPLIAYMSASSIVSSIRKPQ
jgi:DNA-binding IclR family transcriptional regulator